MSAYGGPTLGPGVTCERFPSSQHPHQRSGEKAGREALSGMSPRCPQRGVGVRFAVQAGSTLWAGRAGAGSGLSGSVGEMRQREEKLGS